MNGSKPNSISKVELAARKETWADIEYRLAYSERHTKKELKVFESYYLRGRQPKLEPRSRDPIPLIYRLWLCPDQSIESWQAIIDTLLAGPRAWITDVSIEPVEGDGGESWQEQCRGKNWGWQIDKSLDETYSILMEHVNSDIYDGVHCVLGSSVVPPLGFMGGAERQLVEFLLGNKNLAEYVKLTGRKSFDASEWFVYSNYRHVCIWLDGRRPHNPYMLSYYLAEYWYKSLTDQYLQDFQSHVPGYFYLECYLRLIARYPEPEAGAELSERHQYVQSIRDMLENRPIPRVLQDLWHAAKDYEGVIDLNDLDFKYFSAEDNPSCQPEHYYVGDF